MASNIDDVRNAFAMSFAQSWDTWATIHQLSSDNGTTEYSLQMPLRDFVGTFLDHIDGTLSKDIPSIKSTLPSLAAAVNRIPATIEIPMTMWVTNGSLSQLDVTYHGTSVDMAISHPTDGVAAPQGAVMLTTATVNSLEKDYRVCTSVPKSGWTGYAPLAKNGNGECSAIFAPEAFGLGPFLLPTCTSLVGSSPGGVLRSENWVTGFTCGTRLPAEVVPTSTTTPSSSSG